MLKCLPFFLLFFGISFPAMAELSWAGQLAETLVSVSSTLSLELFLTLQKSLFPVLIVLSVFWIVFYMISLFLSESMPPATEIAKNIFRRGLTISVMAVFFTVDPSFFFDLTITPLIDLALSYGGEVIGATDPTFFQCMGDISFSTTHGLFSPELQARFVCILEHLYRNLMFGVDMGIWLILSAAPSMILMIFFPPTIMYIILKIIFAIILIYSFANLMIDLLWRFIDTLFSFIIGAFLLPFAFLGWAFENEESKMLPNTGGWASKSTDLFKQGAINLIFWCIAVAFIQYLFFAVMGEFSLPFGGETVTPEKIINRHPAFFNEDGSIRDAFIAEMAGSFFTNFNSWVLLIAVALFGSDLVKKIEGMAQKFGGTDGEYYTVLKQTGKNVEKWGRGQIKSLKSSLLKWKGGK
ncbi:MAG: hypothetical protein JW812_03510 [Alphaproteobacteria bacterium]|nr:hypothetical protein [Alphaproteobacteria bacterium]MBN2779774.1 hypothetical protein [Alphaproteobacteria bacterium]